MTDVTNETSSYWPILNYSFSGSHKNHVPKPGFTEVAGIKCSCYHSLIIPESISVTKPESQSRIQDVKTADFKG